MFNVKSVRKYDLFFSSQFMWMIHQQKLVESFEASLLLLGHFSLFFFSGISDLNLILLIDCSHCLLHLFRPNLCVRVALSFY